MTANHLSGGSAYGFRPTRLYICGALFLSAGCVPASRNRAPATEWAGTATAEAFHQSACQLVRDVEQAAPDGVVCEISDATPSDLGWQAEPGAPAQILTIWAPAGSSRSFGLLPRHAVRLPAKTADGQKPSVLAVSENLAIVHVPQPRVSLTSEVIIRERALLDAAMAPIYALRRSTTIEVLPRGSEGPPVP